MAILQTPNLSLEAYSWRLWDIEFGPDYYQQLMDIQVACMRLLQPKILSTEQILEVKMVKPYTTILPFKPPNWVLCHRPGLGTLEETIMLMEVYTSTEAGLYLIPKAWKKKRVYPRGCEHKLEDRG